MFRAARGIVLARGDKASAKLVAIGSLSEQMFFSCTLHECPLTTNSPNTAMDAEMRPSGANLRF